MSKKHKKVFSVSNYIQYLLILISTASGCVSVSSFVCLDNSPIKIKSYEIGLKIYLIIAEIKKYKSIIKKKEKKRDKLVLLAKS